MSSSRNLRPRDGILGGLAGIVHGIAEIRKGDVPTEGVVLESVGAVTVIPNYRTTGFAAVVTGMAVALWTIGFVHRRHGAHLPRPLRGAVPARRGSGPGTSVPDRVGGLHSDRQAPCVVVGHLARVRAMLAQMWGPALVAAVGCLIAGILIWLILLPPGVVHEKSVVDYACWSFLGSSLMLIPVAVIAGFARDIEAQRSG